MVEKRRVHMGVDIAKPLASRAVQTLPLYDAQELTKDGDLAQIQLNDQVYTLRITRASKLILTK